MDGGAHPNERRAVAKPNRVRKPLGSSAARTGWEGERVDRLRSKQPPCAWYSGEIENDGGGRGVG